MARPSSLAAVLLLAATPFAAAIQITWFDIRQAAATPTPTPTAPPMTAVSACHRHETQVWCEFGTTEYEVQVPATMTGALPPAFTDCHTHGSETYCVDASGNDVEVLDYQPATTTGAGSGGDSHAGDNHTGDTAGSTGENVHCHSHAGVEHCTGGSGSEEAVQCEGKDREYNIGLRIGMIFVVLATSLIGALVPILLAPVLPKKAQVVFTVIKQFGTGIIISTALIHLYTHATLMFANKCIGELNYEGTTSAIVMAGIFVAWLVEYASHRIARKFWSRSQYNDEVVSVLVLEAGIIFHSILIGITVVVASDTYFGGLLAVIIFHQMFEGIALGSRIAAVGQHTRNLEASHSHSHSIAPGPVDRKDRSSGEGAMISESNSGPSSEVSGGAGWKSLSMPKKILMAVGFAITTPIGMAIGTGVLNQFNGNDRSTLLALGTLDAISAGILIWVGVVEMWAGDWMFGGELADANLMTTLSAGLALVAGMVLMSVLGKWA